MPEDPCVLAIAAHPDDIEFACAGTIALWVDQGADVTYCIVTDGSTGTQDAALVGAPLTEIRRKETIAAAAAVGVSKVEFLGYRDGYVEPTLDLRRDVARVFRRVKPHRMMVMDPQPLPGGWFVNHPDHRAVAQASLDVTLTAGTTPGHFPELIDEGLEPWQGLRETYVMGPGGGETAIDISSTIDRKIEALRCHASQLGDWDPSEMIQAWSAENGKAHGLAHAELFHVLRPIR